MKKRSIFVGAGCLGLLLAGAVAVDSVQKTAIEPQTISSVSSLVDRYLTARTQLPPLPLGGGSYENLIEQMAADDWSFLSDH